MNCLKRGCDERIVKISLKTWIKYNQIEPNHQIRRKKNNEFFWIWDNFNRIFLDLDTYRNKKSIKSWHLLLKSYFTHFIFYVILIYDYIICVWLAYISMDYLIIAFIRLAIRLLARLNTSEIGQSMFWWFIVAQWLLRFYVNVSPFVTHASK